MWQTIGQSNIIDMLKRALEQGALSHAYLLVGPPQVGKMTLAQDLARALNCRAEKNLRPCGECEACLKISAGKHADVQVVELNQDLESEEDKEHKAIGIGQINNLLHSASLPPFEGQYRVYIINEAGNLTLDAANRLLKTLEEPPARVIFILLTANVRLIPATVISRCQRLNLARLKTSEIEETLVRNWNIEADKARLLARLGHGCLGWAVEGAQKTDLSQERAERFTRMQTVMQSDYSDRLTAASQLALQFGKKREMVYETLDTWAGWWRDVLLAKTGCHSDIVSIDCLSGLDEMARVNNLAQINTALKNIVEAGEQLKLNANPRLVLEALMLNLPRQR